jgi:hypothetical protein
MACFEVMELADEEGWVGVVRRYRDDDGAEFLPVEAKFLAVHVDLAQDCAARLQIRALAAVHRATTEADLPASGSPLGTEGGS